VEVSEAPATMAACRHTTTRTPRVTEAPRGYSCLEPAAVCIGGAGYRSLTSRSLARSLSLCIQNGMKYNPEGHDVHVMAKKLLVCLFF
jgi:hypothetical protein